MKTYTDEQLKRTLAEMLPEKIRVRDNEILGWHLAWNNTCPTSSVWDTELLHLCWLVEETLSNQFQIEEYNKVLSFETWQNDYTGNTHATWQQRTTALAKTKGIEIV